MFEPFDMTMRVREKERELQRVMKRAEVAAALKEPAATDKQERRRPRFSSLRAAVRFRAFSAGKA